MTRGVGPKSLTNESTREDPTRQTDWVPRDLHKRWSRTGELPGLVASLQLKPVLFYITLQFVFFWLTAYPYFAFAHSLLIRRCCEMATSTRADQPNVNNYKRQTELFYGTMESLMVTVTTYPGLFSLSNENVCSISYFSRLLQITFLRGPVETFPRIRSFYTISQIISKFHKTIHFEA